MSNVTWCYHPVKIKTDDGDIRLVPCGKCPVCLRKKRQAWIFRNQIEFDHAEDAWFVTLTYNEEYCPSRVSKDDLRNFFRRFNYARKKLGFVKPVRYFACGEYGKTTHRPHYHALLYNTGFSNTKHPSVLHKTLEGAWDKGFVSLDVVNDARIGYTSKYILKSYIKKDGDLKPFMVCSKNPAIGSQFLTDRQRNYLRMSDNTLVSVHGGATTSLPRYYRDRLYTDDEKASSEYASLQKKHDADMQKNEFRRVKDYMAKYQSYDDFAFWNDGQSMRQQQEDAEWRKFNKKNEQL